MQVKLKNRKIKIFYPVETRSKPSVVINKRYIHSEASHGLWCYMLDQKLGERLNDDTVGREICVTMIVGYNSSIVELWEKLIIEYDSKTYKIKTKPDEYEYNKSDLKILAYEFNDDREYGGATYA